MSLWDQVRAAVRKGDFHVSAHAARRLRQRGVPLWQVEAGVDAARVQEERPTDLPNPSVVCEQELADGTAVTVVWALRIDGHALLVTVFFPDGDGS